MAEFLRKEYKITGKGFEFEGKQLSVWFNEQGMTAGYGTSALENPKFTMSWQEIEKEIRSQVESGAYMGANEAYLVDEVERGGSLTVCISSSVTAWGTAGRTGIKGNQLPGFPCEVSGTVIDTRRC